MSNGIILLWSPSRFAELRSASWLPDPLQGRIERLGRAAQQSRWVGLATMGVGVALLVAGVART